MKSALYLSILFVLVFYLHIAACAKKLPPGVTLQCSGQGCDAVEANEIPDDLVSHPPRIDWIEHSRGGYSISSTEITAQQWEFCVLTGGCSASEAIPYSESPGLTGIAPYCTWKAKGKELHPLNCVTWDGCAEVCQHFGGRLCTGDEWTNACRGLEYRKFPYGNTYQEGACQLGLYEVKTSPPFFFFAFCIFSCCYSIRISEKLDALFIST
jgi:hypothetical protein